MQHHNTSQWAWVLTDLHCDDEPLVFTWPNCVRKYLRETYTIDGKLCLPPPGRLKLMRHRVNPKAGHRPVVDYVDIHNLANGTS